MSLVLAIDQGTTGTTCVLVDSAGRIVSRAYREITQHYPRPGWVEHDADEIWASVRETAAEVARSADGKIAAVGITNQRETTLLWDRGSGRPIHRAIVWQCRRTRDACEALGEHAALFRRKTGLPLDAYFSGTKVRWLLENAELPADDDLLFGTVDSWLIWKLTGGRVHATDATNASRTLLYDIHERAWDSELCALLGVPTSILPEVRAPAAEYGRIESIPELAGIAIGGVAGDQQAALFGQTCFTSGRMKCTYGTGCFVVQNTGTTAVESESGLITTLAADGEGRPCYALEGSVFIAGAAVQWLRDELGLIETAAETEEAALAAGDNAGVFLVPAFVGLGAPHWDMDARGTIVGLTRGANRNHLIRAALESMAFQAYDVLAAMQRDTGISPEELAVDGGAAANEFLLQFQADLLGVPVVRPSVIESTALGAAFLAGLTVGVWNDSADLERGRRIDRTFRPAIAPPERERLLAGWGRAVRQARTR